MSNPTTPSAHTTPSAPLQKHTSAGVCLKAGVYMDKHIGSLIRECLWKPVCVRVNGWLGLSMSLHILGKWKSICCASVCVWHPATVSAHEWIELLTGGITAPAETHRELFLSQPPQICICLSRATVMCFLLEGMFLTNWSPEMLILLLKSWKHLGRVNSQINANNYFPEEKKMPKSNECHIHKNKHT